MGFVSALFSGLRKTKLLSEELGFSRLLRALWAVRIDRTLWSAAAAVFRDAALTGALLGALCGGLALLILLVADASQQTKERWFFYGLYAVIAGVVGVLSFELHPVSLGTYLPRGDRNDEVEHERERSS
jgi:hypothetical protein